MAIMIIESSDPNFSFHIKKNPSTGLTVKGMRQGAVAGWYPHGDTQKYSLWFRDPPRKNSFSVESGVDYLDLTQYASTYFAFNAISTMFNQVLKSDSTQEVHKHRVTYPLLQMRTERTIHHLNHYLGLNVAVKKISDDTVNRMALYEVALEYEGTFNEFMMKVYVLFYLLHGDLRQSDIVWMEGMITKVTSILNELKAPYFLWYWFKKNIVVKHKTFNLLQDSMGENSSDGSIFMQYGDTQSQRKAFVDRHIDNFDHNIIDVGCGEGYYLLPYAKRLSHSPMGKTIIGVEPDDEIREKLQFKLLDRKQDNAKLVTHIGEVDDIDNANIICVEVIEHMPVADAKTLVVNLMNRNFKKLIITTPNRDFNQFYPTMTGFRHDDHHFELSEPEFINFIEECVINSNLNGNNSVNSTYYGVGDIVNGISVSQAVIFTRE